MEEFGRKALCEYRGQATEDPNEFIADPAMFVVPKGSWRTRTQVIYRYKDSTGEL